MVDLGSVVEAMRGVGIFDFFLPFILAFAIFYGLLAKTKILGDPTKERFARTINLVISLAIAAYVTLFVLLPNGIMLSTFLATMFSEYVVVILSGLAFLVVFFLFMSVTRSEGASWDWKDYGWIVLIFAIVVGVFIFLSSGGAKLFPGIDLPFNLNFGLDAGTIAIIAVVVLIILVVVFLYRGEGGSSKDSYRLPK